MSQAYKWAQNPIKLQRAIETVRKTNPKEVTDEAVKAEYRKLLGLVIEDPIEVDAVPAELADLKVADLKKLAENKGIDLGDATRKDDILAILEDAGVTL